MSAEAAVDPMTTTSGIVYLLDATNKSERDILGRWIRERHNGPAPLSILDLREFRHPHSSAANVRLRPLLEGSATTEFIPLRVCRTDGRNGTQVIAGGASLLGDLRQHLQLHRHDQSNGPNELAQHVFSAASLALERAERGLRGARYQVPHLIESELLDAPTLRSDLQDIAARTGRSPTDVRNEARRCLREIAATHTVRGLDMAAALGRYMYSRGFDRDIDVPAAELDRIRALMSRGPVAFVFTHKSHVDGFMLVTLFHDHDLPPLHFFGGINMGFLGLGTLMRKAGAVYLRRSFQDDPVYKVVFRRYIDYLGEKRFPLLWALEGTRSRTGKLMPPRYGMITYVASAYVRDQSPDLQLVPVAITYDQVPEVGDFDALQAGAPKRPESVSWFMQYIKGLKRPHGRIHLRFGSALRLSEFVDINEPSGSVSQDDVRKLGFELAVGANRVTPATVNSLVSYVLLTHGHRALTLAELARELTSLRRWLQLMKLPMTPDVEKWTDATLAGSLRLLIAHGVIQSFDDGFEAVYAISPDSGRKAAYYRNGVVHFLVTSAIADLALLGVTGTHGDALSEFHRAALSLRDLLKHEFFFEDRVAFIRHMDRELDLRAPDWCHAIAQGNRAIRGLLSGMDILFGHGALRPFLEAYLLIAEVLCRSQDQQAPDSKTIMARAHALGRQRLLQHRVHCEESLSDSHFENAIKLASGRGLLVASPGVFDSRQRLLRELTALVARANTLASIAASSSFSLERHE